MKLLVITQKVNKNDSNLGFFHEWLLCLAGKVDKLFVICLEKGEYDLPQNVEVLYLGKNIKYQISNIKFICQLKYLFRFYNYIIRERKNYDAVFVHMNPEYCILGGIFWRLWHKKVLLWYTHKAVNLRLRLGVLFANKIFTASKESFRLSSEKVEVVGHGIPVDVFADQPENVPTGQLCLLAVGRNSPSKDFDTAIKAVQELKNNKNLPPIKFVIESSRSHDEMPRVYHCYHILVHNSRTGSMDKVVLEALASGRIVITSSEAFAGLAKDGIVYVFKAGDCEELAGVIEKIYQSGIIVPNEKAIEYVRKNHDLGALINKIMAYFSV